jgi:hypothetical protein
VAEDRTRLGNGRGAGSKGRFSFDDHGLYVEPGVFRHGDPELVTAWEDVTAIDVQGEEKHVFRTRGRQRKPFHVLSSIQTDTTTVKASTQLVISTPERQIGLSLIASPTDVRNKLGPFIARAQSSS